MTNRSRQRQLGEIVREDAVDIVQVGSGHGFLGLHHFDRVGDPGMRLQLVRQHHTALAVDIQGLAPAVERDLEFLPLRRIRRKACDQALDLGQQARLGQRLERVVDVVGNSGADR